MIKDGCILIIIRVKADNMATGHWPKPYEMAQEFAILKNHSVKQCSRMKSFYQISGSTRIRISISDQITFINR